MIIKKLRKNIIMVVCFCTSPQIINAQATFEKTYTETGFYDRGNAVMQTVDDGYIISGRTSIFTGGGVQGYVIRVDQLGEMLWNKNFGGPGTEEFKSVDKTTDGGFILAGYTNSFGKGNQDIYMVRINSQGDSVWTNTYGGSGIDAGNEVIETSDGVFAVTGETYSFGEGSVNAYLVKVNSKGGEMWTKVFGGNGIEAGNSIDETSDGGYVITGKTNSFGAGDYDIYLIRTDKNGEKIFMQTFGGSGIEEGSSVKQTKDGGYIIAGFTRSFGAGGADVYIVKTDAHGNQLWSRIFGGKTDDFGTSVWHTSDGGYIIAGHSNSFGKGVQIYLIRLDDEGDEIWTTTYGGEFSDDYANSVQQTNDGGFIVTGTTITSTEEGEQAEKVKYVYIIKLDAKGKLSKE